MNVAVMIVHESFLSQYKRHLDMEKKEIADLKKQLETCSELSFDWMTGKSPVLEAEVVMHEVGMMSTLNARSGWTKSYRISSRRMKT